MKKHLLDFRLAYYFCSICVAVTLFLSCSKESNHTPPAISFITEVGYAKGDTTLGIGQHVKVGITARGIDQNITYLNVSIDNGSGPITLLDSGMNSSNLNWTYSMIKTAAPFEKWTVTVMDKDRNKASLSITFTKGITLVYGNILSFNNIVLGAQNNTQYKNFFSFQTGLTYSLGEAFANQSAIDMVYYYGTYLSTLSSGYESEAPNFYTGGNGIANWTVKNETRYDTTDVSLTSFQLASNDSLILSIYNPIDAKRKAKFLTPGMLVSFIDHNGKLGLLEIASVTSGDTGHVVMNLKKQE